MIARKSFTFVPVGPVTNKSPLFLKAKYELFSNKSTSGLNFLFLIFFIIEGDFVSFNGQAEGIYLDWFQQVDVVSNIQTLGQILYTEYLAYFLLAGVILLVAMVGAIVLTMSTRTSLRRQLIYQQVSRDFDNSTLLV